MLVSDAGAEIVHIFSDGCLNPCFSGCWSRTPPKPSAQSMALSLNPCFSGCWSRTPSHQWVSSSCQVLILVLVDVGLGLVTLTFSEPFPMCLNPCFSGCWSRTLRIQRNLWRGIWVLILVLVDVGLGQDFVGLRPEVVSSGLNPCFSGCWSRTNRLLKTNPQIQTS